MADLPAPLYGAYAAVQGKQVYVTGGYTDKSTDDRVYVYDTNTNQWDQLPPSGHYHGIPHIIGGKLAIIGGRLSATHKMTNKVSTFDEENQTWISYYPDLLSIRSKPGVVSHLEHVIVAGGARDDNTLAQDDIEVLNWIENSHWRKVSIKLPVTMYGFTPTISDDYLLIVGYHGADMKSNNAAYKIPVDDITGSIEHCSGMETKWTELTATDHLKTTPIASIYPTPVIVGGEDLHAVGATTADIKMYNNSNKLWSKIGSLSSARCCAAVAAVHDNAIVIIGGCTKGGTPWPENAKSSSLTVVELGQAELFHVSIIDY